MNQKGPPQISKRDQLGREPVPAAHLLTRNEARRIAANVAKLPELLDAAAKRQGISRTAWLPVCGVEGARTLRASFCLRALSVDERLIHKTSNEKLVVRCLRKRYLHHQNRYQLFLRIDPKVRTPGSAPKEHSR
jgi:hypothetical protein